MFVQWKYREFPRLHFGDPHSIAFGGVFLERLVTLKTLCFMCFPLYHDLIVLDQNVAMGIY